MDGITEFTPDFFDEASKAWRANKISIGEGSYRYKRNAFIPVVEVSRKPIVRKPIKKVLRRSPRLLAKKRAAK